MALCIHKQTKRVVSLDTVAAVSSGEYVVYHKRPIPTSLALEPSKYWILDGEQFRLATESERAEIDVAEAAAVRALQIQQIKDRCRADIIEQFPEWKQANMTARAIELLEMKSNGVEWTESEAAEVQQIRDAWAWIKAKREQSNEEESLI